MSNHLAKYQRVSAILGKRPEPAIYWVTSTEWGEAATEVLPLLLDPEKAPTPDTFSQMMVGGNLRVINAKTENQRFVNDMNQQECPPDFAWRRDNLRTG